MIDTALELFKTSISGLKDPWLWLFAAMTGLFIFILASARFVARIAPFKNHEKVTWALDLVLIPSCILCAAEIATRLISPSAENLMSNIELAVKSILWITGAWLLTRGITLFFWAKTFKEKTGAESPLLVRSLVAAAIYVFAFYGIWTSVFNREVTGLLVSTGIIAAVLGLALQSVLSDLFAGLAITVESPFSVGDWIELQNGVIGKVVDVTWRSTRLLSWHNSIYVIPNSVAANSIIHNYDEPEKLYAYWITVSVDSAVPSGRILQLLTEATLTCKSVLTYPSPTVRISDATARPFKYLVYVYFPDFPSHWAGRSELFSRIEACFSGAGISPAAVTYEVDTRKVSIEPYRQPDTEGHLDAIELFKPLTREDRRVIADSCTAATYQADDIIIRKGDTDNSLFIIVSGVVSVMDTDGRGRFIELARLSSKDCFGEMSLLTGEPRSATIKALTAVDVINVPKEAIEPILRAKPELSETLGRIMADRQHSKEVFVGADGKEKEKPVKSYVSMIRAFFGLGTL
jgi:potassium efflux system protein